MKYVLFLTALLLLTACQGHTEDVNVTGHQSLQSLSMENFTEPENPPIIEGTPVHSEIPANPSTFSNQQDFVQHMFDELTSLQGTLTMLDANLGEALAAENPNSHLAVRDIIIDSLRNDRVGIQQLIPYNEAAANLQALVSNAFHYNIEQKVNEFAIFSSESLEERSRLLGANAENERLAAHYLSQAWSEISNLSNTPIYQK